MTRSVADALKQMQTLTNLTIAATTAEMSAAAYSIALTIREQHPAATHVHLEASDQGDWMALSGWSDASGDLTLIDYDTFEDAEDAASHLYLPQVSHDPDTGAVPGLWSTDERRGLYRLDIDRVLQENATPAPVLEVLAVRNPDGPIRLTFALLGEQLHPAEISEFSIDAGAGWEWEFWIHMRDESLRTVSAALCAPLRAALADPPGGKYVEGRDGRDWLTGTADVTGL